jgi:hypothetical protein
VVREDRVDEKRDEDRRKAGSRSRGAQPYMYVLSRFDKRSLLVCQGQVVLLFASTSAHFIVLGSEVHSQMRMR